MILFRYIVKELAIGAGVTLLVFSMLLSMYYPSPSTPRASAGAAAVLVVGGIGTIQETISAAANTVISGLTSSLAAKELVLDGIAFAVINMILQQMSQSIITWINSGFQGSPAFIQDIGGFLTGIADRVAGDYIWGSDLNFLCSPFQLDLRLALEIQYKQTRNAGAPGQNQCTLSGVVANIDNFVNGNFLSGGWNGWFQLTMVPQNNTYGSLLMAQEQFSARLSNSKGMEAKLLEFGKGFYSMKDAKGNIVTPGTAIEAQLNETLDSGRQRIQVADEINEIIAALFTQLAKQAFAGVGGLLGLTQSGNGTGSGTYYNNLYGQNPGTTIPPSQNPIQQAITTETSYRNLVQTIVNDINNAESYKDNTYGAADTCHSGALSPDLASKLTNYSTQIATSNNTLVTLNNLLAQYNAAAGTPNSAVTQQAIMQQYLTLQGTGVINTEADIMTVREVDTREVNLLFIPPFIAEIDTACSSGSGSGSGN